MALDAPANGGISPVMIYDTTNGGTSWAPHRAPDGLYTVIDCPSVSVCYATGDDRIIETTDGGTDWSIVLVAPTLPRSSPDGYWLVGSDGGIFSFGSAQFYGSTGSMQLQRPVEAMAPTSDRQGYWFVASDGGMFAYGDAPYFGSLPGLGYHPADTGLPQSLNAPIVGMVPSHDGGGYFLVGSDGGVFAFGDARYSGSCPGIGGCDSPAVAVLPAASGSGYWLVTKRGSVYAFGDAAYFGSAQSDAFPVTSAAATPDGHGYWILHGDGTVESFGDAARNLGGPIGSVGIMDPATAIVPASAGPGYWIATALGAVSAYGDAQPEGDLSGTRLNAPIIGGVQSAS
jgi:hypothetical protein